MINLKKLGNDKIFLGAKLVKKIFLGSQIVFPSYSSLSLSLFNALVPRTATEIKFLFASDNPDLTNYQRIGYVDNNNFIEVWNNDTKYILINPRNNYIYAPISCYKFLYDYKVLRNCMFDNFNTSYVLNMNRMFANCLLLLSLDLSSFNTKNVTDMSSMFSNCGRLPIIISNTFNKSSLKSSSNMFSGCVSLVGGNGTTYSSSHITADYARVDGEGGLPGYFTAPAAG